VVPKRIFELGRFHNAVPTFVQVPKQRFEVGVGQFELQIIERGTQLLAIH